MSGPLLHLIEIMVCDKSLPPEYYDPETGMMSFFYVLMPTVSRYCKLSVNLKILPRDAITRKEGVEGPSHRATFTLGLSFGPTGVEFKLLYQGRELASLDPDYY